MVAVVLLVLVTEFGGKVKEKRGGGFFYQTVELMGDAHAEDLRVGDDGREPLF